MEEAFLHFIWKFQQFNHQNLQTDEGQPLTIFEQGFKNKNAGPDFKNAKIRIGEITWNGNIEIHIRTSDWKRHGHQKDLAYDNVILHVVWKNDDKIYRRDGTRIPALELDGLIDESILLRYNELLVPEEEILCQRYIPQIQEITIYSMLDGALARRLEAKSQRIFRDFGLTDQDWEEIAWRSLARNFGFKTNAEPFGVLAKSISIKVLKKEAHNHMTIEAMLFGMAGFLDDNPADDFHANLKNEFEFKSRKYRLKNHLHRHQWKFLRLRPANFPTVRIAQLASLVSRQPHLFSLFIDYETPKDLIGMLEAEQSAYWRAHYDFGKKAKSTIGKLGKGSLENILINTVAPLLFAYGIHRDNDDMKEKSLELLGSLKAENNNIIKKWKAAGINVTTAFDSQALIEQFNEYCLKKKCLNCPVGTDIIRKI